MTLENEIAVVIAAAAGASACAAGRRALGCRHHAPWTPMLADFGR
jgi:hypothetical protein